ncbi:uncharacterized protein LOC125030669 [Penaeus chinensis]|uniref:uncharacterized protein LOC125030669 n=1 Tax=Penaeus chinensis TaxID=139456 RepID=UPI001FB83000|nr:uncharacterized protein LOC125030669 [Penaeus chinensis]
MHNQSAMCRPRAGTHSSTRISQVDVHWRCPGCMPPGLAPIHPPALPAPNPAHFGANPSCLPPMHEPAPAWPRRNGHKEARGFPGTKGHLQVWVQLLLELLQLFLDVVLGR